MKLVFWIKFSKDPHPIRIVESSWGDLKNRLEQEIVLRRGDMFEWMVRD